MPYDYFRCGGGQPTNYHPNRPTVSNTSEPMLDRMQQDEARLIGRPSDEIAPAEATRSRRKVVDPDTIYRHVSAGHPSWISDTTGARRPLPIARWLGGSASSEEDRQMDSAIIDLCEGPTM